MHLGERAPESRVVAVFAQLKMLEHEERLLTRLSLAQRDRNSGTTRGKRSEAVSLGGEIVELRAGVCLGEYSRPPAWKRRDQGGQPPGAGRGPPLPDAPAAPQTGLCNGVRN